MNSEQHAMHATKRLRRLSEQNTIKTTLLHTGDCATPEVLMASTVGVLKIYYGGGGLRKTSMTDFGKFAGELAEELGKRDSPQAREQQMLPLQILCCQR